MIPYICIFTAHSTAYSELAEITEQNKKDYAKHHDYDFRSLLMPVGLHYGYERIQHTIDLMKLGIYEWIYWSGTDTMITNFGIKLDWIIKDAKADGVTPDFIVSYDAHGMQNDSFIARSTPDCMDYLQSIMDNKAEDIGKPFAEQAAMEARLPADFNIRKAPQRVLNSFDYAHYRYLGGLYAEAKDVHGNDGQWQPGDFLIHWPAVPLHVRIQLAKAVEVRK